MDNCKGFYRFLVPLSFLFILLCGFDGYAEKFDEEQFMGTLNKEIEAGEQFETAVSDSDQQGMEVGSQLGNEQPYAFVVLRIIGYLAIIIALIFAVAWFIRKTGLGGTSKVGGGGSMDVLEVVSFGQNRNAMLVRVMDSVYLLGQTTNSIVLLDKIEGQNAIDIIATSKEGTSIVQFKDAFNSFIGKIKKSS